MTDPELPSWMNNGHLISEFESKSIKEFRFHSRILKTLKKQLKIKRFFPVQVGVMPAIIKSHPKGNDICVCSPTGSGKTLAYVLPIVQLLSSRIIIRLRALIILPTRDLAAQVASVFKQFCDPLKLKVGTAFGKSSFVKDQEIFVGKKFSDPLSTVNAPLSGHSLIDILVATPGRLSDHIQSTNGFSLQHLQFLVIDEADRLLQQSYHDWISKIYDAAYFSTNENPNKDYLNINFTTIDAICERTQGSTNPQSVPFQKLLFSATLSRNPQHLASLKLRRPEFFCAGLEKRYVIPKNLKEFSVICSDEDKPIFLIKLL